MLCFKKCIIPILLLLLAISCVTYKKVELPKQDGIIGYHRSDQTEIRRVAEKNSNRLEVYQDEKQFIKNSENLEWGLAISGGGVRSASYNLGALKGLYDLNLLDDIQIVSSVSGGGYLSYWMYTNYFQHREGGKPFGHFSFNNEYFLKNVCFQQNKANFVTNWGYVKGILNIPGAAFKIYQKKIHRSYGNKTPKALKITSLNTEIINKDAPYFIINTTIAAEENQDWLSSIFEFTPHHMGNPEIGFKQWRENIDFSWNEAITTSGAGIKRLTINKIKNYSDNVDAKKLGLSDGGHSENLAAIALIRRGVKNIIILDAEHNDDYSFDGYKILKEQLHCELNLDFSIKEIDDFIRDRDSILGSSVYKGTVKSIPLLPDYSETPLDIKIYYEKMSLSEDLYKQMIDTATYKLGKTIYNRLKCGACTKSCRNNKCKHYTCGNLKDFKDIDLNVLSSYWLTSYDSIINKSKKWQKRGYIFPHTTTKDQSYYRNQLSAFIGLGYLQTLKLKEIIGK